MKKKNCRIAFVSNSRSVAHTLSTLAPSMGLEVEIHFAAMEPAIDSARALFDSNVDVVLGCGSTGALLARRLTQPIINVRNSPLDYLRALMKASENYSVVGMPFFETVPEGLGVLAEVLKLRVIPIIFHDSPSLVASISSCADTGIRCIVGSYIAVEIAMAQGCAGVEVPYSEQEVQRALNEAAALAVSRSKSNLQQSIMLKVADMVPEKGLVAMGEDGEILLWNTHASTMLERARYENSKPDKLAALGMRDTLLHGHGRDVKITGRNNETLRSSTLPIAVDGKVCGALAVLQHLPDKAAKGGARQQGFHSRYILEDLVGNTAAIRKLRERASLYAQTDASLLVHGETGTGKELLAHAVHDAGARRYAPFVALNCAALTESLLESELFGYEEGAFTGARRGGKDGIFVLAQGGTVFLDEIADISPAVQVRLLRVLEAREVMRVGGNRIIPIDVRVISSSWKQLAAEVQAGRFRADLYYRLSVLTLELPPLRRRPEDIPLITATILQRRNMQSKQISPAAFQAMLDYSWPGNIRELDALLQRYCLLSSGDAADDELLLSILDDLKAISCGLHTEPLCSRENEQRATQKEPEAALTLEGNLKQQLDHCERDIIRRALEKNRHNRALTAESLGISVNTLWRKMKSIE
ncbi:MAG: sigma 54-interacting transcriptional regulator [Desulfovibrionaceae bacterium]|nr:sigma 54-interacting transcriptional regulator [Desulfovibrionaceae bacterium]